ncbi:Rhodanese-like domain-containing protein [Schizophyllum amplum]|uniref:Rhodanese-like domain-containing protein n=1 Tax=Schizophyllum amplum TaxID=97359 RepID=A0A550C6D8_9AGAR|nr:Rhodanese-like domain-containing protein [Auriculariopsis ampla]
MPWYSAFPDPKHTELNGITPEDLAALLRDPAVKVGHDVLVVDVRRTDFEGVAIKGAINLPAHSFYETVDTIVELLKNVRKVVFHCQSCLPGGRAYRAAGWYADALEKRGLSTEGVYYLEGGIKAWAGTFGEDSALSVKLAPLAE